MAYRSKKYKSQEAKIKSAWIGGLVVYQYELRHIEFMILIMCALRAHNNEPKMELLK